MTYSFNLIDQPWIPIIEPDGRAGERSLRQLFVDAKDLRSVAGDSPLETAAIYRLLLAVLHSALRGPENTHQWHELWQARTWDVPWLHAYLDRWRERFDLFHPDYPFYQVQDKRVKTKSITNIIMDMASGNNAVLFDHHTESVGAVLSPSQAARLVITIQTFGLAGLADPAQKMFFTDAPWARGVIFLVEGDNVFQTTALNLLRYNEDKPFPAQPDDCPAWEKDDPYLPERNIPRGYLDYLTWPNRHIYLLPEGEAIHPLIRSVTISPGLRLDPTLLDPMKYYRHDEKYGNLVLRFTEGRALWRDSAALFSMNNPTNFDEVSRRFSEDQQRWLRFIALGMANDQAKINFFRQEHFPLPLIYLNDITLVEELSNALSLAEETHQSLWRAASWLALLIVSPHSDGKKWKDLNRISKDQSSQLCNHWGVDRFYWGALELHFLRLLEDLPKCQEEAMTAWKKILQQTAWNALDQAVNLAGGSVVALKAAVRARSILGGALKALFPEPEKKEVLA